MFVNGVYVESIEKESRSIDIGASGLREITSATR